MKTCEPGSRVLARALGLLGQVDVVHFGGVLTRNTHWLWIPVLACLASLLGSCEGEDQVTLLLELRTDFVPFQEFDTVETELVGVLTRRAALVTDGDYLVGARIADFDAPVGVYSLRVRLLLEGDLVIERALQLSLQSNTALRVVVDRACRGLACPGPSDADTLNGCFDGACVDPRCTSESREFCGDDLCETDDDCPRALVSCATPQCAEGACLYTQVLGECLPTEWCDPALGCEPRTRVPDPVDGGSDAGRDASVDRAPLCEPSMCSDGVSCTEDGCDGDACAFVPTDSLCAAEPGGTCDATSGCQYPVCTETNCRPEGSCETAACNGEMCERAPMGSCRTGETDTDTQGCGMCGTQTRTRICGSDCEFAEWGDWGPCAGEGICAAGTTRTGDRICGDCGTQTRSATCSASCEWGPFGTFGACGSEGECTAGASDPGSISCGNCGTQNRSRTCSSSCSWGGWTNVGGCSGAGPCAPGAVGNRTVACGDCGDQDQIQTCSGTCTWGGWINAGSCTGEGACTPGATTTRNVSCGDCGTQLQTSTCTASCGWGGYSNTGGCTGEGVCSPGALDGEITSCIGPCGSGTHRRTRTCTSSCAWGTFGPFGQCSADIRCPGACGDVCVGDPLYVDMSGCYYLCSCSAGGTPIACDWTCLPRTCPPV